MTAQQEADAALAIWRAQREAERRGDREGAEQAERELEALLERNGR